MQNNAAETGENISKSLGRKQFFGMPPAMNLPASDASRCHKGITVRNTTYSSVGCNVITIARFFVSDEEGARKILSDRKMEFSSPSLKL